MAKEVERGPGARRGASRGGGEDADEGKGRRRRWSAQECSGGGDMTQHDTTRGEGDVMRR